MTEPLIAATFRTELLKMLADFNDPEMLNWALSRVNNEMPYTDDESYVEAAKRTIQLVLLRIDAKRAVLQAQADEASARLEAFREMPTEGVH